MLTRRPAPVNALEQGTLRRGWPAELGCLHSVSPVDVQPQAPARDVEAAPQQLGILPLASHAAAELRIVLPPAAHVADARHDVRGLERDVLLEPVLEEIFDLPRQAQQRETRAAC